MGWEGQINNTSPPLFERMIEHFEAEVPELMHDGINSISDAVVRNTELHTPVAGADAAAAGMRFRGSTDVPGKLLLSISKRALVIYDEAGVMVYETGAETDVDYAPYVENGTGLWGPAHAKYEIKPKDPNGTLAWTDRKTGHRVFAKRVMHPGSPGAHMFAIGIAETEGEFHQLVDSAMHAFRRRCERYYDYGGRQRTKVKKVA